MRTRSLSFGTLALAALMMSSCSMGGNRLEVRAAGQGAAPPQSTDDMVQAARRHLQEEQYGLAIGQYREMLITQPDSAAVHNGLAVAYDAIGRSDLARRHFEQAIALAPENFAYARNMARLIARDERVALARAEAKAQAFEEQPVQEVYRLRMAGTGAAATGRRADAGPILNAGGLINVTLVTRRAQTDAGQAIASPVLEKTGGSGVSQPFTLERVRTGELMAAGSPPVLKRVSHYEVRVVARGHDGGASGRSAQASATVRQKSAAGGATVRKIVSQARSGVTNALRTTVEQLACERSPTQSPAAVTGMIWTNPRCAS